MSDPVNQNIGDVELFNRTSKEVDLRLSPQYISYQKGASVGSGKDTVIYETMLNDSTHIKHITDAVNGSRFEVFGSGTYTITVGLSNTVGAVAKIKVSATYPTAGYSETIKRSYSVPVEDLPCGFSWTGYLPERSRIYIDLDTTPTGADADNFISIAKVG